MSDLLSRPRWPHQKKAVADVLQAIADGDRRICVTGPTGSGKSLEIFDLMMHAARRGEGAVLYTNRKMLKDQLSQGLTNSGILHGVRASGHPLTDHPLQISMSQTEDARVFKGGGWVLHNAKLALVDEAHIQCAATMQKIAEKHIESGAAVIGFTATPIDLAHMYDTLIVAGKPSELRAYNPPALLPCLHYGPDEPDCRNLKRQPTGEYSEAQVRKVIMTPTIFARVLQWFKKLNPEYKPSILFAPGVKESIWFAKQFCDEGIRAAHIDGEECWVDGEFHKSSREVRDQILADSKRGIIKVLCNRFVLREGIDCPWLCHLIFATIMGSLKSYLQSGGRLLRYHPGIDSVCVQDHGGHWHKHGSLNIDREWRLDLNESAISGLREDRLREKKEQEPYVCPQCGLVRMGAECKCGYRSTQRMRPVIQVDGSLKMHHGDIYRPRVTKMKNDTLELWKRMYWRALRSRTGMTFRQAEALFFVENHYYPPRDLPFMPVHDVDWCRKVARVDRSRLTWPDEPERVPEVSQPMIWSGAGDAWEGN